MSKIIDFLITYVILLCYFILDFKGISFQIFIKPARNNLVGFSSSFLRILRQSRVK